MEEPTRRLEIAAEIGSRTHLISRRHLLVRIRCDQCERERGKGAGRTDLCVDVGDPLDCTTLARSAVFGGDDAAVRTLAELLDELVLGVDDEGGVEGLEGVPLHGGKWGEGGCGQ